MATLDSNKKGKRRAERKKNEAISDASLALNMFKINQQADSRLSCEEEFTVCQIQSTSVTQNNSREYGDLEYSNNSSSVFGENSQERYFPLG